MNGPEWVLLVKVLLLLGVANGTPVIAHRILGQRCAAPLDAGMNFFDGRRLLGRSKTLRGLVLSVIATALAGAIFGLGYESGFLIGLLAMLGDATSSFIKRRLGMTSSSMALGIDQIPESLFPLLAVQSPLGLSVDDIAIVVATFIVLELALSRVLFKLHVRDRPY